jgi:hypothetical protein
MRSVAFSVCVLVIGVGFMLGASSPAVSPRLTGSKARYDQAIKAAQTVRLRAELAAKQAYLKDVKAALSDATKSGKLEEANAISALKDDLEAEIDDANLQLDGFEMIVLVVAARGDWQRTIPVHMNDTLVIKGIGTWCSSTAARWQSTTDAGGVSKQMNSDFIPNTPYAALIGQIGGQQFLIGRGARIRAEHDGDLRMRMNDKGIEDNDGELIVKIFVKGA